MSLYSEVRAGETYKPPRVFCFLEMKHKLWTFAQHNMEDYSYKTLLIEKLVRSDKCGKACSSAKNTNSCGIKQG